MKKENKKQTFAASRAFVWTKCVASEENQAKGKNRFATRNAQADEGTLIHARAARMLGKDIPESAAEFQLFANPESDAQSVVDFYVDVVKRTMPDNHGQGTGRWIEQDITVIGKTINHRVIPDAVAWDTATRTLTIFDLKTGYVSVTAEENEQLIIGAHAFIDWMFHATKMRPTRIIGVIVQPRLSQIEYAEIHYDPEFFDKIDREVKERSGRYVPGSHCKKCNLLTVCKKFRDTLDAYLEPGIKDGLTSRPDEWKRTLAISGPARKFFEELEKEAKDYLELGGTIEDFALKKSGGKRAWFRELSSQQIGESLGLVENELYEKPKLISVAAAEKLIKKADRDKLRTLAYQPMNVSLTTVGERSFLSREGEKIIQVNTGLNLKTKGNKENGKDKRKGKTKKSTGKSSTSKGRGK